MKLRISEAMNDYCDNDISIQSVPVADAGRVRELTMEKLGLATAARPPRPARKLGRMLLVAAAVVLALSAAALAVYQLGMQDRAVMATGDADAAGEEIYIYSAVGAEAQTEPSEEAAPASPEYQAYTEWNDWRFSAPDGEKYDVLLPMDSPYRVYAGWEAMAEKAEEIAAKYGLRLYESAGNTGSLSDFYAAMKLEPFMPLSVGTENAGDSCSASMYSEGSFELAAVTTPYTEAADDRVVIIVNRAMKGTLCNFALFGGEPENYVYETYAAPDGTMVDLALGEMYSFLFAELDNCYITVTLSGGSHPSEYLELLTMDNLKYIADSIDFSALAGA